MAQLKRPFPEFLTGLVTPVAYDRWLARKAAAHLKRDRRRAYDDISGSGYRDEIHRAVVSSGGKDFYTGEELNWSLISTYDNAKSKEGKHQYKASFAMLPTVDHIESAIRSSGFVICSWRTNDAKHDLSHEEFMALSKKVLEHAGYIVELRSV
jgi:hypothetical protein